MKIVYYSWKKNFFELNEVLGIEIIKICDYLQIYVWVALEWLQSWKILEMLRFRGEYPPDHTKGKF